MNKDKQIEEMAKAIEQARIKAQDTTNSMNYGFGGWYAKELYDKGYRKASEVAREIFDYIEALIEPNGDCLWRWDLDRLAELKKKYTETYDG